MWHVWGTGGVAYRVLVGNTEGNRTVGRPKCGWEDKKKQNGCVYWIDLSQDMCKCWAVVNKVMNIPVPYKVGNLTS
jgi:hypothetical protein